MIAGATPEYIFLQSACSSKFVRIVTKNGTVFADDNGQSGRPRKYFDYRTHPHPIIIHTKTGHGAPERYFKQTITITIDAFWSYVILKGFPLTFYRNYSNFLRHMHISTAKSGNNIIIS